MTFEAETQAFAEEREAWLETGQECWVEDMNRVLMVAGWQKGLARLQGRGEPWEMALGKIAFMDLSKMHDLSTAITFMIHVIQA